MVTHQDKKFVTLIAQDLGNDERTLVDSNKTSDVLLPEPLPGGVEGATDYIEDTETGQVEAAMLEAKFYMDNPYKDAQILGDALCKATIKIKSDGNAAHLHDVIFTLKSLSAGGAEVTLGTKTVAVDTSTTSTSFVTKVVSGLIEGIDKILLATQNLILIVATTGKIATAGTVTHRISFVGGTQETTVKIPATPGMTRDPGFFVSGNGMTRAVSSLSGSGFGLSPGAFGDSIILQDVANAFQREIYVDATGTLNFDATDIVNQDGVVVRGDLDVIGTGSPFSVIMDEGGTDRNILRIVESGSNVDVEIGGKGHAETASICRTDSSLVIDTGTGSTVFHVKVAGGDAFYVTSAYAQVYSDFRSYTAGKDLGTTAKPWRDCVLDGALIMACKTTNVSNPPTDAELDAAYGTPATVGSGWTAYIDDNGSHTQAYIVVSDGAAWHVFTGTVAV